MRTLMPMQATTPVLRGPYIRLRKDRFKRLVTDLELPTAAAVAAHIGVDPGTLSRVLSGKDGPGARFIAACLANLKADFGDLFEIADGS